MPIIPSPLDRGCLLPVLLAWLGIFLGLVSLGSSAMAAPAPPVGFPVYAAGVPTPAEITAYTTAMCGAVVVMVNTLLLIWHKLSEPKRRRRKPRNETRS